MEFDYTEEQQAIQDSLQRWLGKHYSFERRREWLRSEADCSEEAWATYAEMGLLALPLPEAHGGLGGSGVDTALVMEQLGAALALEPYLPTVVLGAGLVAELGSPAQCDALLPAVAEGRLRLALAHQEPGGRHARHHVATTARREGAHWVLDGRKAVVLGAPQAQRLLVSARTAGADRDAQGISLFLVDAGTPGLAQRAYANHDGQRAAELALSGVRVDDAARLGPVDGALPAIERALDRALAALCAEAVGVMSALNAATLDYLKTRQQFGVAIGSFQALQHRMADMVIAAEQARSMATLAAVKCDAADAAERSRVCSAAKAFIGQQGRFVGQQAMQLHGGMGLTDELMAAHLFKRLTLIDTCLGDTDHHFERFSRSLAS